MTYNTANVSISGKHVAVCEQCGNATPYTIMGKCQSCLDMSLYHAYEVTHIQVKLNGELVSKTRHRLETSTKQTILLEVNGKEVARTTIGESPTNERTTGLLRPYMQDLLDAGFALDTVLERGYDFAEYLVTKELRRESKSCDEIEVWPRTASLVKDIAKVLGIARKQQEQAMEKHS